MIIYGILFNDKIIYIGQTIRKLTRRISSYKTNIKNNVKNSYIVNHLRKYGIENHKFIIIDDDIESRDDLNLKEKLYIEKYNTLYPNGFNLTTGGDSPVMSDKSRQKMSKSRMGKEPWNKNTTGLMGKHWAQGLKRGPQSIDTINKRKRFGENNHFYGRHHSKESKQKMSDKLKGRKVWNKVMLPVAKMDKLFNVIKIYSGKDDLVKEGFEINSLNRAIKKQISYRGFYFKVIK